MRELHQGDVDLHAGVWDGVSCDSKRTARVSCPSCGVVATLDHEISADGSVNPSLDCPSDRCTFHDHVKLVGWATE